MHGGQRHANSEGKIARLQSVSRSLRGGGSARKLRGGRHHSPQFIGDSPAFSRLIFTIPADTERQPQKERSMTFKSASQAIESKRLSSSSLSSSRAEATRNWLALGLLLAAWNASDDRAAANTKPRPDALRGYACVSVRAVHRCSAAD